MSNSLRRWLALLLATPLTIGLVWLAVLAYPISPFGHLLDPPEREAYVPKVAFDRTPWKRRPETRAYALAVSKELAGTTPSWAGRYSYGDGLCRNYGLSLAPRAGFSFGSSGCLGLYAENWGSVRNENGELSLDCLYEQSDSRRLFTRLVPIRWGGRSYLIPPDQIVAFCNDIKAGLEPRSNYRGDHFLRSEDWTIPVSGRPALPERYRFAWEAEPILGRISQIVEARVRVRGDQYEARVRLDLGARDGAWLGLGLICTPVERVYLWATIEEVEEASSIASVRLDADDPPLELGWPFERRRLAEENER